MSSEMLEHWSYGSQLFTSIFFLQYCIILQLTEFEFLWTLKHNTETEKCCGILPVQLWV